MLFGLLRKHRSPSPESASDGLADGRTLRCLTMVDVFTRECPAIEIDTSLSGRRVVRVLERLVMQRGRPEELLVDNGPEFISRALVAWCEENQVRLWQSSRESQHRTDTQKVSMGNFVMNASTRTGS
jgi:putative transposase